MTILIIAHRLTTIESANNLLFFKSRSHLVSAAKGTSEYKEIFEKLKCISYAAGDTEKVDEEEESSSEESMGELEEIQEDADERIDDEHCDSCSDKPNQEVVSTGSNNGSLRAAIEKRLSEDSDNPVNHDIAKINGSRTQTQYKNSERSTQELELSEPLMSNAYSPSSRIPLEKMMSADMRKVSVKSKNRRMSKREMSAHS